MAEMALFAAPVQPLTEAVLQPGIYFDISERAYHADPCPAPSLSASSGKVLLNRSARAFQWMHPRLRPAHLPPVEESYSDQAVFGTVVSGTDTIDKIAAQPTHDVTTYGAGNVANTFHNVPVTDITITSATQTQ